ncbi:scoloptoxin SSD552-like [Anthonomus grandis grandis]|uniref:scoloptoxin SSD552-like n=1 Tax=Anthonomus grandis grandis TaxID=2921223 RepID=UPI0021652E7A|nr:scoloptoxin SSD552-like [Anthonomus grandis grandis]
MKVKDECQFKKINVKNTKMRTTLLVLSVLYQICSCYNGNEPSSPISPGPFSRWKSRNIMYTKDFDWCTLNCEAEKHVGCIHKGNCTPIRPCVMPKYNPADIVEEHNKLRNKFAKGETEQASGVTASNVMALDWDWDLAYLAACNLKNCVNEMKHDFCHRTEKHNATGQNLGWSKGFKEPCEKRLTIMVNEWFDHVKTLTADQIKAMTADFQRTPDGGPFTQLVWAEVSHVGCALTSKKEGADTVCLLTCNYGPGGNSLGGSMYKAGAAASECPSGVSANAKYPGLCGKGYKATDDPYSLNAVASIYGKCNFLLILLITYTWF